MALTPGARLGVYEVTAQIGEGGMGQVFRARDTKLNRDVALKVLPDSFARDTERVARFTREAQTLASLNHPNIAHIHGLEESPSTGSGRAGMRALVMELVEGDDLSQRIARGAIPLDEALPIAKQIAEALEAAHEQGIIHRDLKPANIKVRPDGTVKVLDFGLAKALDRNPASATADNAPTITSPAMTMWGTILGSAAYMAPEQAKGKPVDRGADIWAFGAVLYEMLTGQRAFKGEDATDTIAAVVSREPDWSALPASTPAPICKLLRRCLAKDRKRRLDSAAAVRLEIEDALTAPAVDTTGAIAPPAARARLPWALVATLSVALIAGLLAWAPWRPLPVLLETRVDIVTPATDDPGSFALSPDGRQIVFVGSGEDGSRLWLRSLAATTAEPLERTEGATTPFWAPDGRSLGFFAGNALKRLDLAGGVPQTLAPALGGRGGTWSAGGVIVFSTGFGRPLMRVSASGGPVVEATTLGPQQTGHGWPHLLPDGRSFLFHAQGRPDTAGIYLGALDGSAPTRLTPDAAARAGAYLPSGWLLWVREATLVVQRLDLVQAELTGEPHTLADGVDAVSVAATGLVAYRSSSGRQRQLTWIDRTGMARGTVGAPDGNDLLNPRVSRDGLRVVVSRTVQGNEDLWLLDAARTSRVTFDTARDNYPVWSPDGTRIAFRSNRKGGFFDLYQASTGGVEERLVASDQYKAATSWSADGRFLLYASFDPQTNNDLWVVEMAGDRTPSVLWPTPFNEFGGAFSPDGRWVAYHSNESGRREVYVRTFFSPGATGTATGAAGSVRLQPGPTGGLWQVSTAGGVNPAWRPDGKELYYLNPEGAMVAAPIRVTGSTLEPGAPVVLFPTRIYGGGLTDQGRQYDVAPDGRFLINTVLNDAPPPITLLQNWHPELKK